MAGNEHLIDVPAEDPWPLVFEVADATPEGAWVLVEGLMVHAHALRAAMRWLFPDTDEDFRVTLRNGVLVPVPGGKDDTTVPASAIAALAAGSVDGAVAAGLTLDGDESVLHQLLGVLDPGDPDFAIVTP
jgi:alkyl sulfatase BDS1-like metallo-beta-lactamase superfamily hydrolase